MLNGINKISVLTPYNNEVSTLLADYLQRQGLEILSAMHMIWMMIEMLLW